MNALVISIPAGVDLPGFNAQAAVVDAKLAAWAAGVTIPVNIGGGTGLALPAPPGASSTPRRTTST